MVKMKKVEIVPRRKETVRSVNTLLGCRSAGAVTGWPLEDDAPALPVTGRHPSSFQADNTVPQEERGDLHPFTG